MERLRFLLAVIGAGQLVMSCPAFVLAENERASKQAAAVAAQSAPARPADTDMSRTIEQLQSVRDYDRLYWILDRIEHEKDNNQRSDWLARLDGRVQDLIRSQGAGTVIIEAPVSPEKADVASKQEMPSAKIVVPQMPTAPEMPESLKSPTMGREADKKPAASFDEVKGQIDGFRMPDDSESQGRQIQALAERINQVQDSNKRIELYDLLRQRTRQQQQISPEASPAAQ